HRVNTVPLGGTIQELEHPPSVPPHSRRTDCIGVIRTLLMRQSHQKSGNNLILFSGLSEACANLWIRRKHASLRQPDRCRSLGRPVTSCAPRTIPLSGREGLRGVVSAKNITKRNRHSVVPN